MDTPVLSACLRVFNIPELAQPICAYAPKEDIARLLRVSRLLFFNLFPYVWRNVDNVVALAALIPGAGLTTYVVDPLPPLTVMRFPGSFNLSRFNIYAPYIRELEINSTLHIDEYDNWDGFLAFTRSRNLLPNLERIRMVPSPSSPFEAIAPIGGDTIKWATAFLSTSLRALWIAPDPRLYEVEIASTHFTWTTLDDARSLLQLAFWKCPMLDTLAILPGDLTVQKTRLISDVRGRFSEYRPPFPLFPPFRNLRTLITSPSCLEPKSFGVLSTMPSLESLSIRGLAHLMPLYGSDLSIPEDAFPSLRHLEFTNLRWQTVFSLCNLEPLVRNLVTLRIHPILSLLQTPNYPRLVSLLSILVQIGSPLTELSVTSFTRTKFYPEVFEQLKHFSLVKLSLRPTELNNLPMEALSSALPQLEVLHLLPFGDGLHIRQLRVFTTLFPKLRHLSVPICRNTLRELTDEDLVPASGSQNPFCLESDFVMRQERADIALKLARYLYLLWPSIECVDGDYGQYPGFGIPVQLHVGDLVRDIRQQELHESASIRRC
ncbi:hypothetical protein OPQ81_010608 [Rhizoctonia solani]|nr:hypothetical protein OPQ81_010608 [Rhizoctonia solani]